MKMTKQFAAVCLTAILLCSLIGVCAPMQASAETIPMTWGTMDKGYVTIVYDDNRTDLPEVYDIITKEYGLPFCAAVPSNTLPRNLDTLHAIQDNGGEILAHGHNHTALVPSVPWTTVESEYKTSYEKLTAEGFLVNGTIKCGGGTSEENDVEYLAQVEAYSSKYFKYADMSGTSTQYYHPRIWMKGQGTIAIKNYINNAIADKKWIVLFAHSMEEVPAKYLRTILDYMKEKQELGTLEIVTYRDMYKKDFANWATPVDLDTLPTITTTTTTTTTATKTTTTTTTTTNDKDAPTTTSKVQHTTPSYLTKTTAADETPDAAESQTPDSSSAVDAPINAPTASDAEQPPADKPSVLPYILIGAAVAICTAGAIAAALIWRKKHTPPTE